MASSRQIVTDALDDAVANNGVIERFPAGGTLGWVAKVLMEKDPALKEQYNGDVIALANAIAKKNNIVDINKIKAGERLDLGGFLTKSESTNQSGTPNPVVKPVIPKTDSLPNPPALNTKRDTVPVSSPLVVKLDTVPNAPVIDQTAVVPLSVLNPVDVGLPQLGRKKIVVIDAGHGGHDPGAVCDGGHSHHGHDDDYEKDQNLAQALSLGKVLEARGDCEIYYTRNNDTFVSIDGRRQLTDKIDPDFFISFHTNSNVGKPQCGMEIYYDAGDVKSKNFGLTLQKNLNGFTVNNYTFKMRGVKPDTQSPRGNLGVLTNHKDEGRPTQKLLVETGFLNNPVEWERMKTDEFMAGVNQAIIKSMDEIFNAPPLPFKPTPEIRVTQNDQKPATYNWNQITSSLWGNS